MFVRKACVKFVRGFVSSVKGNGVRNVVLKSTSPLSRYSRRGLVMGVDGRGEEGDSVCFLCLEKGEEEDGRGDDIDADGHEMVHNAD